MVSVSGGRLETSEVSFFFIHLQKGEMGKGQTFGLTLGVGKCLPKIVSCRFLDLLVLLGTRWTLCLNGICPVMGESLGKLIFRDKPKTKNLKLMLVFSDFQYD